MEFLKRRKFRRSFVRQRDLSDCGPACLASICAGYGLYIAITRIRQMAGTDKRGTNVLGMVDAATQLGFDVKGVKTDYESFSLDIMPAIAHVLINKHISHYVVVQKISGAFVHVMDPAEGRFKRISGEEFKSIWTGVAILLVPGERFRSNEKISSIERIIALASPYTRQLTGAILCAVVVSVIGLVHSYYIKEVIDEILPRGKVFPLNVLSGAVVTTLLIQFISAVLKNSFVLKVNRGINMSLVAGYFKHVMHLPKQFFDNMRTGEVVSRINDALKISAFLNEAIIHLFIDVLIIGFSLAFMFIYNWQIALVVIAIVPVYLVMYLTGRYINRCWQRKLMESSADFEAQIVESITSLTTVRYLGLENHFCSRAESRLKTLLDNVYTFSKKQITLEQSADFITRLFSVVLLWAGSYYVLKEKLTTGELVSFYSLLTCFTVPVLNLIAFSRSYGEAKIAGERLFEILDLKTLDHGCKKVYPIPGHPVTIRFENVKFRYGNNQPVLENVNLQIGCGITGIKGKSGSGKSTLAALLLKSIEPESGSIWINGVNLRELSRENLTEIISIAHQQSDLFTGTISENISIGMKADGERIHEISDRLGITEFAERLPDGMNTWISEYGSNLSGGQRQRISIARALYRNTPVLILDEATVAIDAVAEEKIMQTIEWYKNHGNTVIIIAHSDTTLKICDNIAVLEDGAIK